mgnify:CR=1 FL=1
MSLIYKGLDSLVNAKVEPFSLVFSKIVFYKTSLFGVSLPLIVIWLVVAAIIFSLSLYGVQFRGLCFAMKLLKTTNNEKGEISHFQALWGCCKLDLVNII